jgi:hypothetical protein
MPNIVINSAILLPPDMVWEEEFGWSPMSVKKSTGLTGALLIQIAAKRSGGRPITLASGDDYALLTRAQLQALTDLDETVPVAPFLLVLADGRSYTVLFDGSDGQPPITATPIQPGKEPAATDRFRVKLRFVET